MPRIMGRRLQRNSEPDERYKTGQTVVLSDPAPLRGTDHGRWPATDTVTFWSDDTYRGLQATAARFKHHCFRPHTHDGLMLGLIDAGTKSFVREKTTYIATAGSISIVNAGDLHTGSRVAGDELRYRALYIPVSILGEASGTNGDGDPPGFRSGVVEDKLLFCALDRLHSAIVETESRLAREQFLSEAVSCLAIAYGSVWRSRDKAIAVAPKEVRKARALLEARFSEDISVSDVATAIGISPHHLMRQFRRHVGIPMHAFQTQVRVERSKRLLISGMPAAQVALEVGFADQSHFSKRFKERVGASPVAYQRNLRSDGEFSAH